PARRSLSGRHRGGDGGDALPAAGRQPPAQAEAAARPEARHAHRLARFLDGRGLEARALGAARQRLDLLLDHSLPISAHFLNHPRAISPDPHASPTRASPDRSPPYAGKGTDVPWPSMADAHACHKHVMISGKVYRTVSDGCWSVPRRIEDMGAMQVASQALSP